jgi:hypothetical protein
VETLVESMSVVEGQGAGRRVPTVHVTYRFGASATRTGAPVATRVIHRTSAAAPRRRSGATSGASPARSWTASTSPWRHRASPTRSSPV